MADADGQGKGRGLIFCAAGLSVAVAGIGIAHAVHETRSRLHAVESAGKAFPQALGSGDGRGACGRMTRAAQARLAADQHRDSCPAPVAALVGPLTPAERHRTATSYASVFFAKEGGFGHVGVGDNPLQIVELLLSEIHGEWLVAEVK
ncbi:hypothetical protein [Streptomyces sp. NPDC005573]|uniref:hypothetical protein n=1 Tax=Streptomyces sp. NPDC005573 TaxID=3156890 RepID=UPI0033AEC4B0